MTLSVSQSLSHLLISASSEQCRAAVDQTRLDVPMAESEQIIYHITDLISEQVSDFSFGHQKCPF